VKAWAQPGALTPWDSILLCSSTLAEKHPQYEEEVARQGLGRGEDVHSAVPSPPSTAEHRRHGATSAPHGAPSWWPGNCVPPWRNLVTVAVPAHPI